LLELDAIRKYLSMLMAKDFRQFTPGRYPIPTERVRWFMQSTWAKGQMRTPYAYTVWAEVGETLTSRARSWAIHSMLRSGCTGTSHSMTVAAWT
jgi:hypothetical protein